jgi:hypothetical protein
MALSDLRREAAASACIAAAARMGVTFVDSVWMEVLGAPVGALDDADASLLAWLKAYHAEHKDMFKLIPRLRKQSAYHILKQCAIPKMTYLMRVCPTHLLTAAGVLSAFDNDVCTVFKILINTKNDLTELQRAQVSAPVRAGGFGFRRCTYVAPSAFFSSFCQAVAQVAKLYNDDISSLVLARIPHILTIKSLHQLFHRDFDSIASKLSALQKSEFHKLLPPLLPDALSLYKAHPSKGLQKFLVGILDSIVDIALFNNDGVDKKHKKLLETARGKGAGTVLNTLPTQPSFLLENTLFAQTCRLRLGLSPFDAFTTTFPRCVCSQENSPDHTQICPKLRKLFGYDRHQEVVHCLSRICKTQGLHIEYEPAILVRREAQAQAGAEEVDEEDLLDGIARSTRKRPDLAIHLYNETLLVDVSIAHPFAPSYAKKSSEQVIEAREKSKASKYKRATGTIVHPFVLDTFGNRGKCLDQVLKRIKQCAVLDKPKFMKHSRLQVSFAAHRAAARCAVNSAAWISSHAHRAVPPDGGGIGSV